MGMAALSEGPLIRDIPGPSLIDESFEYLVQGDVYTSHLYLTVTDSCGAGKKLWVTTIEMLPEDTRLDIFDFYRLDAEDESWPWPWIWHRLAHVCRKWRRVISMSPRRLDLGILCDYGAPVETLESVLDSWPTLPLYARFEGQNWPALSINLLKNTIAALRRPDRVCEIDLVFHTWTSQWI